MREPRNHLGFLFSAVGITPAHAGTTSKTNNIRGVYEDHPRSCGNHQTKRNKRLMNIGSPPLMREPLENIENLGYGSRITPAHAGTTVKGSNNYANSFTIPKEIYLVSLFKFSFVVQFVHFFI